MVSLLLCTRKTGGGGEGEGEERERGGGKGREGEAGIYNYKDG